MIVIKYLVHFYFWFCAIGFPLLGMHWLDYERKASKWDYKLGYDEGHGDGYESGYTDAEIEFKRG